MNVSFINLSTNIRNLWVMIDHGVFLQIFENEVQLQPHTEKVKVTSLHPFDGKESVAYSSSY